MGDDYLSPPSVLRLPLQWEAGGCLLARAAPHTGGVTGRCVSYHPTVPHTSPLPVLN